MTVIWQPEIVESFTNADPSYADSPPGLQDAFLKNVETVESFLERAPPEKDAKRHLSEVQKFLLSGIRDQHLVGMYSKYHDNAVYKYGYFHEEAKRLAYM